MEDKTKKELMELGVGIASVVLAEVLLQMKKEGKLNTKEAQKMMKRTMANAKKSGTKYAAMAQAQMSKEMKMAQSEMNRQVNRAVDASPFATKKEFAKLNAKIDKLSKMSKRRR